MIQSLAREMCVYEKKIEKRESEVEVKHEWESGRKHVVMSGS